MAIEANIAWLLLDMNDILLGLSHLEDEFAKEQGKASAAELDMLLIKAEAVRRNGIEMCNRIKYAAKKLQEVQKCQASTNV